MRVNDIDAVEENDNETERSKGVRKDDSEAANTEVISTLTVQGVETQSGNKDWQ